MAATTIRTGTKGAGTGLPYVPAKISLATRIRAIVYPGTVGAEVRSSPLVGGRRADLVANTAGGFTAPILRKEVLFAGTANERDLWYEEYAAGSQMIVAAGDANEPAPRTFIAAYRLPSTQEAPLANQAVILSSTTAGNYGGAIVRRYNSTDPAQDGLIAFYGNTNQLTVGPAALGQVSTNAWHVSAFSTPSAGLTLEYHDGVVQSQTAGTLPVDKGLRVGDNVTRIHRVETITSDATYTTGTTADKLAQFKADCDAVRARLFQVWP